MQLADVFAVPLVDVVAAGAVPVHAGDDVVEVPDVGDVPDVGAVPPAVAVAGWILLAELTCV